MDLDNDKQQKRLEKKEDRDIQKQVRKDYRQTKRDIKLDEQIEQEAGKYGIDFKNLPTGPMSQADKDRITSGIRQTTSDEFAKDITGFAQAYEMPEYLKSPDLNKEQLKKDYKKQRRAKISDALTALGRGLQQKSIDPSTFKSSRIEQERQGQYKQFRDVVDANKARSERFQQKYREDLIDFLDGKIKDKATSAAEKLKLEKLKADVANAKRKGSGSGKDYVQLKEGEHRMEGSNPYTKLLQSLDTDITSLIPPKADGKAYTPTELENQASQIIMQMYDKKYDRQGKAYLAPKEGAEGYVETARESARIAKELSPIEQELELAKMDLEDMGDEGTKAYELIDKKKRKRIEDKIADLEAQKASILESNQTPQAESNPQSEHNEGWINMNPNEIERNWEIPRGKLIEQYGQLDPKFEHLLVSDSGSYTPESVRKYIEALKFEKIYNQ